MVTLAIIAAILIAVIGVARILSGDILVGILLLILACAIGPGGWTVLR